MDFKALLGLGDKLDAKGIFNLVRQFLPLFLPQILAELGQKLRNKDADDTGADDAFGRIVQAASGPLVSFVSGGGVDGIASDKAMKAIYDTSRAYCLARNLINE